MPKFESKSKPWFDQLDSLYKQGQSQSSVTRDVLKKVLNLKNSQITNYLNLIACFDPGAVEKVRLAAQEPTSFNLSFNSALALAGLKGKVPDLTGAVHSALEVVLSRGLATEQIKALVVWIISGKPAVEFDPTNVKPQKRQSRKVLTDSSQAAAKGEIPLNPPLSNGDSNSNPKSPDLIPQTIGQRIGMAVDGALGRIKEGSNPASGANSAPKMPEESPTLKKGGISHSAKVVSGGVKDFEKVGKWIVRIFWHWTLKNIHYLCKWVANLAVPLHQSRHSGQRRGGGYGSGSTNPIPVVLHWGVYSLCQLVFWWVLLCGLASHFAPGLKPWVEFPIRYLAYLLAVDFPAWVWHQANEHLVLAIIAGMLLLIGIGRAFLTQSIHTTVLLVLLGAGWFYGRGWGTEKLPFKNDSPPSQARQKGLIPETKVPTTPKLAGPSKAEKPTTVKKPTVKEPPPTQATASAQPWNSDMEEKAYLEGEMAALPLNKRIKAYAIPPDPMSAEMSMRRLEDLQNQDQYTLKVGKDPQKILSVSPAMTGFTLTYTDPSGIGGILGGNSKIEFYWEDVKTIHCDEITAGTRRFYQFGLVANGLKKPFTVQCASADELKHLVSAFEFWIGAAGKGRQAPITGIPYLSQGLRLDSQSKVTAIWTGSPANLAVEIGEVIWSLDSETIQPQGNPYLESALETLASGKHFLYVVTPTDWGNGPQFGRYKKPFNPKRKRVELVVH